MDRHPTVINKVLFPLYVIAPFHFCGDCCTIYYILLYHYTLYIYPMDGCIVLFFFPLIVFVTIQVQIPFLEE